MTNLLGSGKVKIGRRPVGSPEEVVEFLRGTHENRAAIIDTLP
jgi:hypothetical protein